MTTVSRRFLIAAPWLSLPLLLGSFYLLWNRLPAQLAVQFDASGHPTNSMSKGVAVAFDTVILLILLLKYSLRLRGERRVSAGGFIIFYVAVAFVTSVFLFILRANL